MTDAQRTLVAQQALDMSKEIDFRYAERIIGDDVGTGFRLLLTTPDGPSTDGGKKARQSFSLVPAMQPSGKGVMMGWLDVGAEKAALRSYQAVNARHEQRFGKPFPVSMDHYDVLVADLCTMLEDDDYFVETNARDSSYEAMALPEFQAAHQASNQWVWIAVAVMVLIAALAVVTLK